ncbi:MAG: hypothetical protein ACI90V_012510, partial [Bacillariaceae sp.]
LFKAVGLFHISYFITKLCLAATWYQVSNGHYSFEQ